MTKTHTIRLGTRGSSLALTQANMVKAMLEEHFPDVPIQLITIKTTGDIRSEDISSLGGKGVFIKEIEAALLNNEIDLAVHSFKDITSKPHDSLVYSAFLLQERVTDAFVLFNKKNVQQDACVIATGSMRRQALCRELYPNITCVPIRGNIDNRIKKAKSLGYDGLILSTAGLQRLDLDHLITHEPDPVRFIPAPGQGMLAIQHRVADKHIVPFVEPLIMPKTHLLGVHYFRLLQGISFNCNLPFGAYINGDDCHAFIQHKHPEYFKFKLTEMPNAIDHIRRTAQ